jgi:hypothetical protein
VPGSPGPIPDWQKENARRLRLAGQFLPENDELLGLLHSNLQRAGYNRYNLEVMTAIARLCR